MQEAISDDDEGPHWMSAFSNAIANKKGMFVTLK
jgi:hypothetical protein